MTTSTIVAAGVLAAVAAVAGLAATAAARRVGAWFALAMAALVDIARLPDAVRELIAELRVSTTRIDALDQRVTVLEGNPA